MGIFHPAWIEVDVARFQKNLSVVRKKMTSRLLCVAIKANAYGHGLLRMGKIASESGADYLGVACLQEAIVLRESGLQLPILVLGALHEEWIDSLLHHEVDLSVSSLYKAKLVAARCEALGKKARVHLEIDTGMQRTGVRLESAPMLLQFLQSHSCFDVVGIYSHLATADQKNHPFTKKQIDLFRSFKEQVGSSSIIWHLANSGGCFFYPESHFDMVRVGLACYGYLPDGTIDPTDGIAPCLSLKAKISYFKVVAAGEGIGYGHSYRTKRQTRIITVPVGHGDGYRRALSNKGAVLLGGTRHPIVGAICMDQCMVDVGRAEAHVGDEVTLIGKQGNEEISLQEVCNLADTIPYEFLSALPERLPRVYRN